MGCGFGFRVAEVRSNFGFEQLQVSAQNTPDGAQVLFGGFRTVDIDGSNICFDMLHARFQPAFAGIEVTNPFDGDQSKRIDLGARSLQFDETEVTIDGCNNPVFIVDDAVQHARNGIGTCLRNTVPRSCAGNCIDQFRIGIAVGRRCLWVSLKQQEQLVSMI